MHEAFKIFILSTIIITLWMAFLLLQDKRSHKLLNRWFAAFLVALTLPQMDLYANQIVQGGYLKLALVAASFLWLKGPFMWTFIQVLTRKDTSLRRMFVHFIPWCCALVVLLNAPRLIVPFVLAGMCHMLAYLLACLWQLIHKRRYLADVWNGFQNSAFYWLLYVIGGVMLLGAVDLVVMSLVFGGLLSGYDVLDYFAFPLFSIYVLSVGFLSVYRPELLFREPSTETFVEAVNSEAVEIAQPDEQREQKSEQQEQKERYLELDQPVAQALIQQLAHLMQEQHVYRQNELSLPELAVYLDISVHQVSELLNVHIGCSFYDYLNQYRLEHACRLLADADCQLRILDIVFEAGYNNKNTFYRVFKDSLGVTPNQYRASALGADSPAITPVEI